MKAKKKRFGIPGIGMDRVTGLSLFFFFLLGLAWLVLLGLLVCWSVAHFSITTLYCCCSMQEQVAGNESNQTVRHYQARHKVVRDQNAVN